MCSIQEDNNKHLDRFKYIQPHPSYIAGFIDGDGCIFIRKIRDGYQSGITIAQSRTNILQIMRYHFGGTITSTSNRNSNKNEDEITKHTKRNQFNYVVRSNEYNLLLNYIKYNLILKEKQINCLNTFSKLCNKVNRNDEKDEIFRVCNSLNNKTYKIQETEFDFSRLNIIYIAGLFDAEGCIYINKNNYNKFYVKITQKNNPIILHKIKEYFGYGNIYDNNCFKIENKRCCVDFIEKVKPHLIVKYNQANLFIIFANTTEKSIKDLCYHNSNKEKHEVEEFYDINSNNFGKDSYLNTIDIRSKQRIMLTELLLQT
jgi:LAGLIDADG endonuclease